MRKHFVLSSIFFSFICLFLLSVSSLPDAGEETLAEKGSKELNANIKPGTIQTSAAVKVDLELKKFPLYFTINKGQVNKKARFYARASKYTLWLTKEGLVFDSFKRSKVKGERSKEERGDFSLHSSYPTERDVSRLLFVGANKNPGIVPVERARLKVNYFIGNDKSKWHCDVPTSLAVLYKNIYKNIDLKVYGIEDQIEYDWIIKPGGNAADIKFTYKNIKTSRVDEDGNLVIETKFGELIHKKPVGYQERRSQSTLTHPAPEKRIPVDVEIRKIGKNTYGLAVDNYDKSRELIIDPVVLAYSTYLGGGNYDSGKGIAVDSSGNAYVTGWTGSSDFPTLNDYHTNQGKADVFITKIDTTQSGFASLVYSTYFGGSNDDYALGIAVDSSENVYVTGNTRSTDFPSRHAYQTELGWIDAFVIKLDTTQNGTASLIYSTYLGGNSSDEGRGIAVDSMGNAYVTGMTYSTDFPVLNQYMKDPGDGFTSDSFVTKIDTSQSGTTSLVYSTYLGGGCTDEGNGIAVDISGFVYVTGYTDSTDFPTLDQYQSDQKNRDAFVTKIDATQNGTESLIYSTYLGGRDYDSGHGIAVDDGGYAYVTGYTDSNDFPTLNQYQKMKGRSDAFVTKIDTTQSGAAGLVYSTCIGGADRDKSSGIAVDNDGNVYVTGYTSSSDFPTLNDYQVYQGGISDVFVAKIDTTRPGTASMIYSTCLGGEIYERGEGIAVDSSGNAYVTGYTRSIDFPILNQYMAEPGDGAVDAFVTKLTTLGPPAVTTAAVTSVTATSAVSGGNVTSDGGAQVTARGVCWSISANPTTGDSFTSDGSGTGSFTSSITGLTPATTYYVRAYAVNSLGTGYGKNLSFKALNIALSLKASRESESAWLISRQYGKIELEVENPGNITVAKYVIYRKEAGGNYSHLIEIPSSQLQGDSYLYFDKYLDKAKSYTYKSKAVDAQGMTIGVSNEKTI